MPRDDADLTALVGFDLGPVRRAVGSTTYERGAKYARTRKVLKAAWDADALQKVVALNERKRALFRGVMDDGNLFSSALTGDVRDLLT